MTRRFVVALAFVTACVLALPPTPAAAGEPGVPVDTGTGRRIVYSKTAQRVWLVESDGSATATFLVSGRMSLPRPGTYRVFSKSRYTTAAHGLRMEYMVRFARPRQLALGFHSIPVDRRGRPIQTEAELGRPRSSGCVRLRLSDAAQIWNWAPIGTTVVVLA